MTWTATLTLFRSAFDAAPTPRTATWSALASSLARFETFDRLPWVCTAKGCKGARSAGPAAACPACDAPMALDKRHLPAWSPATFRGTRSRANVVELCALVLDHDDGEPIEAIHERWASWPHILHTSWSHTPEHPKCRVVVPFARPVSAARWPRVWAWAVERDPRIDRKCSDASRLFFRAAVRSHDWPRLALVHDEPSELLDLTDRDLPRLPTPRQRAELDPICTPRNARKALTWGYKNDASKRRELAARLGATLRGAGVDERASGVTCPGCARPDVWWWIDPQRAVRARCNHANSCGWSGFLDELDGATA